MLVFMNALSQPRGEQQSIAKMVKSDGSALILVSNISVTGS